MLFEEEIYLHFINLELFFIIWLFFFIIDFWNFPSLFKFLFGFLGYADEVMGMMQIEKNKMMKI